MSIDIDPIAGITQGTLYSFVRLTDNDASTDQSGIPYGEADIDAVGAISSARPANPVPEASTIFLLGTGLVGLLGAARNKFFKE
jgi:hypothetical protein